MPSSNAALHSGNPLIFKRPASPTKICLKGGGNMELFKPGLCFSYRIFLGRAVNMTKRSGKFENVYSEIAWRGQREQRREGADGCRCSRSWRRFSTRTSVLVSFWGRFQQSLPVGYEGSLLMMLLT